MSTHVAHGRWVVWLTFLVGIVFQIMPLPDMVAAWRPDWLLMVMIYWAMALPHRYSILTAWVLGVLLDIMLGAQLGIRALAFSLVIYLVALHYQRLRNFPRWQQTLVIALFIVIFHFVEYWLEFVLVGPTGLSIEHFYPAFSSIFVWWWVFWMLRNLRRRYHVR